MTQSANQFLSAFDALPPNARHEVTTELLRRIFSEVPPEISEEVLVGVADELFQQLDADEADNGNSQTG